jgi:hypothetical protein
MLSPCEHSRARAHHSGDKLRGRQGGRGGDFRSVLSSYATLNCLSRPKPLRPIRFARSYCQNFSLIWTASSPLRNFPAKPRPWLTLASRPAFPAHHGRPSGRQGVSERAGSHALTAQAVEPPTSSRSSAKSAIADARLRSGSRSRTRSDSSQKHVVSRYCGAHGCCVTLQEQVERERAIRCGALSIALLRG